jgi:RND superfamily putative drug exporter
MSATESGKSRAAERVTSRPWVNIIAWAVFFAVLTPTALTYTNSINYAGESANLSGSESARAQALLSTVAPSHSTLVVAVQQSSMGPWQVQNATLAFQSDLATEHIAYVSGSGSVYSSYAVYLDGALATELPQIRTLAANVANLTNSVYSFPAKFLSAWVATGAGNATIGSAYAAAGGAPSGYEPAFRDALQANYSTGIPPAKQVQRAVEFTAPGFFPVCSSLNDSLSLTNVTSYTTATPTLVSNLLDVPGTTPVPASWVQAAIAPGDFGANLVAEQGLSGLPAFLRAEYLSPDGSLSLVLVVFTVSDDFRESDGTYPAQAATPEIRSLAQAEFGSKALVTGPGAVAYDSQQIENGAGVLFALTFILLAIAVAITLRSWIAPLLALMLVSLSLVIGYLAIILTGWVVGKVDFVVTYTLMAVTLGVATDYAVFLLYRYREELTRGLSAEAALLTATRSSGFAIIVSATTVAVGLGTLSFLSGLQTWGPVLAVSILGIGLLEVLLLPAVVRLIGPRLFVRRWVRDAGPPQHSWFYRAASGSGKRPMLILMLAVIISIPAVVGFIIVPTSYNFDSGLPANTPSTQGQLLIEDKFGANLLYPTYVIVTAKTNFIEPNGSISPEGNAVLPGVAANLLDRSGVQSVEGPFVYGTNLSTAAYGSPGAAAYSLEGGKAVYYTVYSVYGPYSTQALAQVQSLRDNSSYLVGGVTSSVLDQQASNGFQYPVLGLILTLFIGFILAVAFRSWTVPLISISGVFLSISVTTGLLYLIATYILNTPLLWLIPLILFVILMSLGNDYTVFLLVRIREEQSRYGPFEGIRRGIAGSGIVVSALGLILAASLGSLALQPISFLQEVGIAFIISLVLDTFVVRPFYFPAMLTLVERRSDRLRMKAASPPEEGA